MGNITSKVSLNSVAVKVEPGTIVMGTTSALVSNSYSSPGKVEMVTATTGLVIGYLRSVRPTFGRMPAAARWVFMELGLQMFMAGVGVSAGSGIVDTLEDFGTQGERPTHPELLDWLATELMESGWSMKHVHRQIVLSEIPGLFQLKQHDIGGLAGFERPDLVEAGRGGSACRRPVHHGFGGGRGRATDSAMDREGGVQRLGHVARLVRRRPVDTKGDDASHRCELRRRSDP